MRRGDDTEQQREGLGSQGKAGMEVQKQEYARSSAGQES